MRKLLAEIHKTQFNELEAIGIISMVLNEGYDIIAISKNEVTLLDEETGAVLTFNTRYKKEKYK